MNIYQDPAKLQELSNSLDQHQRVLKRVEDAQENALRDIGRLDKNADNYSETLKRLNDRYDKLEKRKRVVKESLKGWMQASRTVKKIQEEISGIDQKMVGMAKKKTESMSEYVSHVQKISQAYRADLGQLKARKVISESLYKKLMQMESKYHNEAMENAGKREKLLNVMSTGRGAARKEAERAWSKDFFSDKAAGGVAGGLASAVGFKSKTLGAMGGSFKGGYESMERVRGGFKEMKEMMKDAGGGVMSLAGGLKALGKALKGLNWIGMLVGAIKAVVSAINELDDFMKDLNKTWMTMAGSTVLMKDVSKSMKNFNDAIFNVGRNMRLGLQAKDIQGFFKAMSTGGLSLEGVQKRAGDYNEAIERGFKLSRQFGVSFGEMGQMMSKQMLNLRSSLEDVSEAFKGISYDAAMAGVSSQKFYQIVENVSTSLSFYGNYLKSTSDMLRTFSETGLMGFKDASETVQTLMGTIKGMGMDQRRALINIIGEDEILRLMKDRVKRMDAIIEEQRFTVKDLESRVGGAPSDSVAKKELEAARVKLHAAEMDKRNLQESIRTGDISAMAGMLDVLSDDIMASAAKVMNNLGVDFFEDKAAAYEILNRTLGWNIETTNKAMKRANVSFSMMREQVGYLKTAVQGAGSKNLQDVADDVNLFFNHPKLSPIKSLEDLMDHARKKLAAGGFKTEEIERLLSLIRETGPVFRQFTERIQQSVFRPEEAGDITVGEVKKWASVAGAALTQGKEADITNQRMEELVEKTTPIAKYLEIGKENVKYALAGSDLMANISVASAETAKNTGSILAEIIAFFNSWGEGKREAKREEFASTETHASTRYKQLQIQQYAGVELLESMKKMGADPADIKSVSAALAKGREQITEIEKDYSLIPSTLEETRREARMSADEQLASMHKQAEELKEMDRTRKKLMGAPEAVEGVYDKDTLERAREGASIYYNAAVSDFAATLKSLGGSATGAYGGTAANVHDPDFADKLVASLGFKGVKTYRRPAETTDTELEPEQDFLVKRGGIVNLKRGDIAVDSTSLAKGIGMGAGQIMNYGPGIMKGGAGGGLAMSGVTLNFNAPMDGKPEEYRRIFIEAVEDVVNRMKYNDKMRA